LLSKTREVLLVYQELLADASLFALLLECDRDLANQARKMGCPSCGDVLDRADFQRHPKGGPIGAKELGREFDVRFSFCCRREGCRKRCTPESVRFLGRRVYLGAIVVLVSALREGLTPVRLARLQELVGVCARTVRRWQRWWKERFPQTDTWRCILRIPADRERPFRTIVSTGSGMLSADSGIVSMDSGIVSGHSGKGERRR
jgi:hypothetical protein